MLGFYSFEYTSIEECIRTAFFSAAIPEETSKLVMLWLLLRKNRFFDEKVDGIVYAVFVSLGFAAVENIMYLFNNLDEIVRISVMRALFAVPAHFCFGILMGYYYSLVKFYPATSLLNKILVLAAPVLAHGVYDSILFVISTGINPLLSVILFILFLFLCKKVWRLANDKINEHLERDRDTLSEQVDGNSSESDNYNGNC